MKRLAALALPLALLAACAAPSAGYGPAANANDFGYRDQRIEEGRFRISYTARDRTAADDGALRRAAEVTLSAGGDWFQVVSRDAERTSDRSGPRGSVGIGGGTGRRSGVGVGVGVSVPITGGSDGRSTVSLEILVGTGPKPDGQAYYDARAVLSNLTP